MHFDDLRVILDKIRNTLELFKCVRINVSLYLHWKMGWENLNYGWAKSLAPVVERGL